MSARPRSCLALNPGSCADGSCCGQRAPNAGSTARWTALDRTHTQSSHTAASPRWSTGGRFPPKFDPARGRTPSSLCWMQRWLPWWVAIPVVLPGGTGCSVMGPRPTGSAWPTVWMTSEPGLFVRGGGPCHVVRLCIWRAGFWEGREGGRQKISKFIIADRAGNCGIASVRNWWDLAGFCAARVSLFAVLCKSNLTPNSNEIICYAYKIEMIKSIWNDKMTKISILVN